MPARDMRVLVGTADFVAVGFNVPVAELLTSRELLRHQALRELGPDLLDEPFDLETAAVNARARKAGSAIADVLLNQRVVAGIGNVFKSEILFVAAMHPFTPASEISSADLNKIFGIGRELLRANTTHRGRRRAVSRTANARQPGSAARHSGYTDGAASLAGSAERRFRRRRQASTRG